MRSRTVTLALLLPIFVAACEDTTRTLAGGEQIDALQRVKTVSEDTEEELDGRFKKGLNLNRRSRDLEEAAEEATDEDPE